MDRRSRKSGGVSAYIVLALSVLLTSCLGVASYGIQTLARVRRDRNLVIAEEGAFAALDYATGRAFNQLGATNGKLQYAAWDLSSVIDPIAPGCTAKTWITPTSDSTAYVTADVTYKGVTRSVRNSIKARDVSIWNNAIFAGSGASGQAINGNVDIRGSVHILGDGEPYLDLNGNGVWDAAEAFTDKNKNGKWDAGEPYVDSNGDGQYTVAEPYNDVNHNSIYDPPLTQTSLDSTLGGTAYIGNNYYGLPSSLIAMVPGIPTISGVASLGAEVRVKHGQVSINGSASIGSNSILDGGLSKATIDGSYVNDGYTGNQGASHVYSDNGTTNQYDLGNLNLELPIISGVGAQPYTDKSGTAWTNEQTYLDSRSLTVPITTLSASTPAFSYGPDAYGNSISFTPGIKVGSVSTPAILNIHGVVKVNGNFQLGLSKELITYQGSGTFYAAGNMNIDASIVPLNGLVFPTSTRLGLIAKNDMNLATGNGSAQLLLAGAFYAQGTIRSAKQNVVAGSFVASYYDLGTNVPSIAQVPVLTSNMPPAMPGDQRYFTMKVLSFRDRSPKTGQSDTFTGGSPYSG